MKQDRPKVKYTVVDPNAPCEVQKMLKKMIAEKLLAHLLAEAADRGARQIFLEVRVSNTPAIKLYEKLNFKVAGSRKGFYQSPSEDALVMQRSL